MEHKIKENIHDPEQLETFYREDKKGFKKAFFKIYPDIAGNKIAECWKARLEFGHSGTPFKTVKRDVLSLIVICVIIAFLIKIPQLFGLNSDNYFFYAKNAGLIVFLGLFSYAFATKRTINFKQVIITAVIFIVSALYINLLPSYSDSDSINLAYLHLPLMMWCLYGLIFVDFDLPAKTRRMDYIRYNGDLVILMAVIMIAGAVLSVITIELFSTIGIKIEQFYVDYIVICGLTVLPLIATFIIRRYPGITNKISPVIANIFAPLVLITLLIYLIGILATGKNLYGDRDFLLVFNLMLLGVMAIIVFSLSENKTKQKFRFHDITLFALSLATLIVDLIAVSAIIYRLGEYGFTPNRLAVLGSNLLILIHLILIMLDLYRVNFKNREIAHIESTIAAYLPVYAGWIVFVVFGFPLIFGLK